MNTWRMSQMNIFLPLFKKSILSQKMGKKLDALAHTHTHTKNQMRWSGETRPKPVDAFIKIFSLFGCFWEMEKRQCCNTHIQFIYLYISCQREREKEGKENLYAYLLCNDVAINIYSIFICSFLFEQNGFRDGTNSFGFECFVKQERIFSEWC